MTEFDLSKKVIQNLKKQKKRFNVYEEHAHISGTTDILLVDKSNQTYALELKLKPNQQLINQLEKQNGYNHFLIAITLKPKKEKTANKWKKKLANKKINLFYFEDGLFLDYLIKNDKYDYKLAVLVKNDIKYLKEDSDEDLFA